ncbi:MAG: D-arabinono-1,4-lactone oxidase [Solirubrobacteraceae bacterium]
MATPPGEAEIASLVAAAATSGMGVRVAGAGHSFSPVVQTDGLLLDLSRLSGIVGTDAEGLRAVVRAGTPIRGLYEPLWQRGLALRNQGAIDDQHLAGAVATATHGSGISHTSLSGVVRSVTLIGSDGQRRRIGGGEPRLLRAAQVAVGMLGVMTELEIEVASAYRLTERVGVCAWEEVMERWDELVHGHRHANFFWMPMDESASLYGIVAPGTTADRCYVKTYDEAAPGTPDLDVPGCRTGRCYRIYPGVFAPNFHELEYFVALERGPAAVAALRELMLASLPDAVYPLGVRTVGADDAYLSPSYLTDTVAISIAGAPGTDYWTYLRSADALLAEFDARVHWGKLHFLTPERLHAVYPAAHEFIAVRRELDPHGIFLNEHLRSLFE